MPDETTVAALAKVLRGCGFWATHADRWNDAEWQDALWRTLARALLASPALAGLLAEAWDEGVDFCEDIAGESYALAGDNPYRADREAGA